MIGINIGHSCSSGSDCHARDGTCAIFGEKIEVELTACTNQIIKCDFIGNGVLKVRLKRCEEDVPIPNTLSFGNSWRGKDGNSGSTDGLEED